MCTSTDPDDISCGEASSTAWPSLVHSLGGADRIAGRLDDLEHQRHDHEGVVPSPDPEVQAIRPDGVGVVYIKQNEISV